MRMWQSGVLPACKNSGARFQQRTIIYKIKYGFR